MNLTMKRTSAPGGTEAHDIHNIDTRFDLLGGAYANHETTRKLYLGVLALASVALVGVVGFGAWQHSSAQKAVDQTTAVKVENAQTTSQLNQLDQAEGFSADMLRGFSAQRQSEYVTAIDGEVDMAQVLRNVKAAVPDGATLQGLSVNSPALLAPVEGAIELPEDSPVAPAVPVGHQVSISGTVNNHSLVTRWARIMQEVEGLENLQLNWSGGGGTVAVNMTATISTDVMTQRARQLAEMDTYGFRDGQG